MFLHIRGDNAIVLWKKTVEINKSAAVVPIETALQALRPCDVQAQNAATHYIDKLKIFSQTICEFAAQQMTTKGWENSHEWKHALRFADACCAFADAFDSMSKHPTLRPSPPVAAPAPARADEEGAPSDPARSQPRRTGNKAKFKKGGKPSSVGASTSAATGAASGGSSAAKAPPLAEEITALLKKHPQADALASGPCRHPLALAQALSIDCRAIAGMIDDEHDPIDIAHALRTAVKHWFGDLTAARALAQRCTSAGPAEKTVLEPLEKALHSRIETLRLLTNAVDSEEADRLARGQFPKESHLLRLHDLGQIASIQGPLRLPSAPDDTVFEFQVQPRPLLNNTAARPFYVHAHSRTTREPSVCSSLPLKDFVAVHIKTAAQRSLGAKWEKMSDAFGSVYRGKINSVALWNILVKPALGSGRTGACSAE